MKPKTKRLLWRVTISLILLSAIAQGLRLQLGLTNIGQEFGTYGEYNRVLRVVGEMEEIWVKSSSLNRDLDLKNLGHLNHYSVEVIDRTKKISIVSFNEGDAEIENISDAELKELIRKKIAAYNVK